MKEQRIHLPDSLDRVVAPDSTVKMASSTLFRSVKPKIIYYVFADCGSCFYDVESFYRMYNEKHLYTSYEIIIVINTRLIFVFDLLKQKIPTLNAPIIWDKNNEFNNVFIKNGMGNQFLILDNDLNVKFQNSDFNEVENYLKI